MTAPQRSYDRILAGPAAPQLNLALYRRLAGEPKDLDQYLRAMAEKGWLIYEFTIERTYGQY